MVRKKRVEIWRRPIAAITDMVITDESRWLYLSPKWWSLVQSMIGEMEHPSYWIGTRTDIQTTIKRILEIEAQIIEPPPCEDCPQQTQQPLPTPISGGRGDSLADILSQYSDDEILEAMECLDMACGNCIHDVRIRNGVLEVYKKDDCNCLTWQAIGSVGRESQPPGVAGSNIGSALLNQDGTAIPGATIPIPDLGYNPTQNELRACAKATKLVDTFITMMEVAVEFKPMFAVVGNLPFGLSTAVNAIAGYFASVIPELGAYITMVSVAKFVDSLSDDAIDEFEEWLNDETRRETTICTYTALISRGYEVTSDDLVNLLASFGFAVNIATSFVLAMQSLNVNGFVETFQVAASDSDCGCSQISNPASVTPPPQNAYDWCRVWDFKVEDWNLSDNGAAYAGGQYVAGVGYETRPRTASGGRTNRSGFKNVTANVPSRQWTSVDLYYTYEAGSEVGSNADPLIAKTAFIEIEIAGQYITRRENTIGAGWIRWEGSANEIGWEWFAAVGYDVTATPSDPTGKITVTKVIVRGMGTDPFATLADTSIAGLPCT